MTLAEFIRHLAASGLMAEAEIEELRLSFCRDDPTASADRLTGELVQQHRLTEYQVNCLVNGKSQTLVLGNYVILENLGQGGMGTVFKARHRRMKRVVALKVLLPSLMNNSRSRQRFQREVEAAARLSHPNIVTAFDADEDKDVYFLVMEYVKGQDYAAIVRDQGPQPVGETLHCILQAARGLQYAHSQGVIHRDVKPANLLLDNNGRVKIFDMGLARFDESMNDSLTDRGLTQTGAVMGTIDYMAPEQAVDTRTADQRSDIYGLGCTLYFLLIGEAAYPENTMMKRLLAHREHPLPSLRVARPDVPESIDAIFLKMIAKKPDDRYQSMTELIADLEACQVSGFDPIDVAGGRTTSVAFDGSTHQPVPTTNSHIIVDNAASAASAADKNEPWTFMADRFEETIVDPSPPQPAEDEARSKIGLGTEFNPDASDVLRATKKRRRRVAAGIVVVTAACCTAIYWRDMVALLQVTKRLVSTTTSADSNPPLPQLNQTPASQPPAVWVKSERMTAEWVLEIGGRIRVSIDDAAPRTIERPDVLPSGRFRILELDLAGNIRLDDEDLKRHLSNELKLQVLLLDGKPVSDAVVSHLGQLRSLRRLTLEGTRVTSAGVLELQRALPDCEISHSAAETNRATNGLTPAELQAVRWVLKIGGRLEVQTDTETVDVGSETDLPQQAGHLTCIRLEDNTLLQDADLSNLAGLTWLTMLDLEKTRVGDAGLKHLAGLPSLQRLKLDGTLAGDATLQHLKALTGLKVLDLNSTRITDAGLAHLAGQIELAQLFLGDTEIGDQGLGHLAECVSLETLSLYGTQITDDGLKHLRNLSKLRTLSLENTGVSAGGLEQLKTLKGLRELYLKNTRVTGEDLLALQRLLPDCRLIR